MHHCLHALHNGKTADGYAQTVVESAFKVSTQLENYEPCCLLCKAVEKLHISYITAEKKGAGDEMLYSQKKPP
jgi:hypothetical protein